MHPSRAGARRAQRALASIALAITLVSLQAAPAAAAQTDPWGTYPASNAISSGGSGPRVVLVADSLIALPGSQPVADHLRATTGRTTYVSAAGAASFVTYAWPGQQNGNPLVYDAADFLRPGVTVMALGTNDARIMTWYPASLDAAWQRAIMGYAVQRTKASSTCILLVNVRARPDVHPGWFSGAHVASVNANMDQIAASYPDGRVRVADWNAHSAGQASWFLPGDVHHTTVGSLHYVAFIRDQTIALQQEEGC